MTQSKLFEQNFVKIFGFSLDCVDGQNGLSLKKKKKSEWPSTQY